MNPIRAWQTVLGLLALGCAGAFVWLLPWARPLLAGEETATLDDYIILWSWMASAVNWAVFVVLLFLCPWWAGKKVESAAPPSAMPGPRWFWPAVLGAMLLLAFMTFPRLGQSLWDDEETSVRFSSVGRYLRTPPDGRLYFHQASWAETLFYYKQPNNHVLHNMLARTSNSIWRGISSPQELQFREEALRLPAFVAGLAGLLSMAWLLKSAGFAAAGAITAWILALHPWYQRYACEARGYSLIIALLPVAIVAWRQGMLTGRWSWWSLLGVVQFALIWTYPAVFFVLLPLNLAVPLLAWRGGTAAARPAVVSVGRWFCCQALAAVAALQVMAPLLPQARDYFRPLETSPVGVRWVLDYLGYLGAGLPWDPDMETPGFFHPRLTEYFATAPWLWTAVIGTAIGLVLAGALLFFRRSDAAWKTALACALAGPFLQLGYAVWTKLTIWEWYLLHALPWFAALAALGMAGVAQAVRKSRLRFSGAVIVVVILLAGYGVLTEPVRQWQAVRPVTPTREAVLATRPSLDPHDPANKFIMTAGLTNPPAAYDGNVFFVRDPAELILLCRMADAGGRPLWLNIGHLWAMESDHLDTYNLVRDRRFFDQHRFFRGHTALGDRLVCRYVPRSLQPPAAASYLAPEDEVFIERNISRTPEEYFSANY